MSALSIKPQTVQRGNIQSIFHSLSQVQSFSFRALLRTDQKKKNLTRECRSNRSIIVFPGRHNTSRHYGVTHDREAVTSRLLPKAVGREYLWWISNSGLIYWRGLTVQLSLRTVVIITHEYNIACFFRAFTIDYTRRGY